MQPLPARRILWLQFADMATPASIDDLVRNKLLAKNSKPTRVQWGAKLGCVGAGALRKSTLKRTTLGRAACYPRKHGRVTIHLQTFINRSFAGTGAQAPERAATYRALKKSWRLRTQWRHFHTPPECARRVRVPPPPRPCVPRWRSARPDAQLDASPPTVVLSRLHMRPTRPPDR